MDDDDITEHDKAAFASATAATPEAKWNADCNRVFFDGVKRFGGEFEDGVARLKEEGVATPDVLLQLLETDDPARTLHTLAQNPDDAKLIAAMPPVRRASAIAALERGEPLPTNNATPAWKQSRSDIMNPNLSDREFAAAYDRKYGRGGLPGRR